MRKRSLPFFMSWMISSGVSLSRCALVSAAAQAIRPGSAEPTRATAPATPAALRNARRPRRSGLRMLILLDRALLLALGPRSYGTALPLPSILKRDFRYGPISAPVKAFTEQTVPVGQARSTSQQAKPG